MVFRKIDRNLSAIQQWGQDSGFLPSKYSFVFVSNHDKYEKNFLKHFLNYFVPKLILKSKISEHILNLKIGEDTSNFD